MGRTISFIILAVLAWVGGQYFFAVYNCEEIKEIVEIAVAQHRYDSGDGQIVNDIINKVTEMGPFKIDPKSINISRRSDGHGIATIKISFTKTIKIPFIHQNWILHFNPVIQENLDVLV